MDGWVEGKNSQRTDFWRIHSYEAQVHPFLTVAIKLSMHTLSSNYQVLLLLPPGCSPSPLLRYPPPSADRLMQWMIVWEVPLSSLGGWSHLSETTLGVSYEVPFALPVMEKQWMAQQCTFCWKNTSMETSGEAGQVNLSLTNDRIFKLTHVNIHNPYIVNFYSRPSLIFPSTVQAIMVQYSLTNSYQNGLVRRGKKDHRLSFNNTNRLW